MTRLFDPPSAPGLHLSEDLLILMVCEELSPEQRSLSKLHFDHCQRCQARFERFASTTRMVDECRQRMMNQLGPLPPAKRDRFIGKLDNLLEAADSGLWWKSWKLQSGSSSIAKAAPILAGALIAICASFALYSTWRGQRPTVSAAEFMNRAVVSDQSSPSIVGSTANQRRFRYKTANQTSEHDTNFEASANSRPRKYSVDAKEADLATRLASAGVNWDEPLSADSFKKWHDRQLNPEDEIHSSVPGLLTMSTRLPSSAVARESLTVREDDFHPVERIVEYRDSGKVEISEVGKDSLPANTVNKVNRLSVARPPELPVPAPAPAPRVPAFVPLPSMTQINETELEARIILNRENADTGEQIAVKRDARGVYVEGMVDTEERKKELDRSLQSIPFVSVSIRSFDDLKSSGGTIPQPADTKKKPAVASISPLELFFLQQGRSRADISRISAGLFNCSVDISRSSRSIELLELQYSSDETLSPAAIHLRDELLSRIGERLLDELDEQKHFLDDSDFNYDWAPVGPRDSPMDSFELARLAGKNMAATTELVSGDGKSTRPQKLLAAELARTILQLRTAALTIIPGLSTQ